MYIILEGYASHDPRLVPELEFLDQYNYWHYDVAYIAPENVSKVELPTMNYLEVPEEVARAAKFVKANSENRLGILAGSEIHDELIHATLEAHSSKPKVYYQLTEEDQANAIKFFKAVMTLALMKHYNELPTIEAERNSAYKLKVLNEIQACSTMVECRKMMHHRFGTATSSVLAEELNWGPTTVTLTND